MMSPEIRFHYDCFHDSCPICKKYLLAKVEALTDPEPDCTDEVKDTRKITCTCGWEGTVDDLTHKPFKPEDAWAYAGRFMHHVLEQCKTQGLPIQIHLAPKYTQQGKNISEEIILILHEMRLGVTMNSPIQIPVILNPKFDLAIAAKKFINDVKQKVAQQEILAPGPRIIKP